MSHDIRANLTDLLDGLLTGKLMEKFELYYGDDVVMSENGDEDPTRVGKEQNRAYEAYFAANAQWHGAKLGAIAVDQESGTAAYELWMDFTINGQRLTRHQATFQVWKDGKIVRETFYYR